MLSKLTFSLALVFNVSVCLGRNVSDGSGSGCSGVPPAKGKFAGRFFK